MTFNLKPVFGFSSILILLLFQACQNPGADPTAVRQELRQREIVHLSQGQITERAVEMADSMLLLAESDFSNILPGKDAGLSCLPAMDSSCRRLEKRFPVKLRFLGFSVASLRKAASAKEKEIIEACLYSRQHHLPLGSNLQKDGEKEFLFTRALTLKNDACISCHQNHERPDLRGEKGDTIGFSILRLSRKQVVMSFVE